MAPVRFGAVTITAMFAAACVETEEPPPIPNQVSVSYGERIYLVDDSQTQPQGNVCTKFGTATSSAGGGVVVNILDDFGGGTLSGSQLDEPHNCFLPVTPKTITVDQTEVTNDLFQLCIDSDICNRPDPADASEDQVCAGDFDRCPVVDVPLGEATRFCQFIGRRLPSMVEHIAVRQAEFVDASDPQPEQMLPYPNGSETPTACSDARLPRPCGGATSPDSVGPNSMPTGAAAGDVIAGNDGPIFDLIGNQAEWSSDGFAAEGGPGGLPWFCIAPLLETNPPTCPIIDAVNGVRAACVYGDYQPNDTLPYGTYPVCITSGSGQFNGAVGALAGGGIQDQLEDRRTVGTFARRVTRDPDFVNNSERSFGFRCIDDRPSADANGNLENFNFVEVDRTFTP